MNLTQGQLEWIVREVVRRLRDNAVHPVPTTSPDNGRLVITERLITIETLRDKLCGIQCVEVATRAIVTPAVVDWLNDQKIELTRQQASS